jgi:hypothetical protein
LRTNCDSSALVRPQDHQQIITSVRTPRTMRVSCVVLRGRDEIQARGAAAT